ncbi:uncharacterized protein LOC134844122 isoform X2 [Symsagittifera roscoffensis]|uniref:uncharacterized protein LOC134844122 isoform X2 n=1 Tax=Symsagittifera roscoffensis TaxID=84072 RepID=UPI00307C5EF7
MAFENFILNVTNVSEEIERGDGDGDGLEAKDSIKFVFIFIRLVLQCFGIFSGCIVMMCVYKFAYLRQPHNLLVCSLSVSDVTFLLYETVYRVPKDAFIIFNIHVLPIEPWVCNLDLLQNVLLSCQLSHMLLVAIDRFLFINWPLQYPFSTGGKKYLFGGIFAAWAVGILPVAAVSVSLCVDFRRERELAFVRRIDVHQHVIGHSTLVWFLILFLLYSNVFWKLEKYIRAERRLQKRKISPPSFFDPRSRLQRNTVALNSQMEQLLRNSEKEKTVIKGYVVRMTFAFLPQALRYFSMIVVTVTDRETAFLSGTTTGLLWKHFVLLTVVGATSCSGFVHCFSQSRLKNAAKKLLTLKENRPNQIPLRNRQQQQQQHQQQQQQQQPRRLVVQQRLMTSAPRQTPLTPSEIYLLHRN